MGRPISALHPKQEAAALVLARGGTMKEAAKTAKAGERTVKTWVATVPAFARRVSELDAEVARTLARGGH